MSAGPVYPVLFFEPFANRKQGERKDLTVYKRFLVQILSEKKKSETGPPAYKAGLSSQMLQVDNKAEKITIEKKSSINFHTIKESV